MTGTKAIMLAPILLGAAAMALGGVAITGNAEAAERMMKAPSSGVKPPAMKKPRLRIKKKLPDCTPGFSPGTYRDDPDHAKYYCKTTGLLCPAPYTVDKVEYKSIGKKRLYYTCRINVLNNSQSVNSPLCTTYFQNSMSNPQPGKHYFFFCISKPIACSSDTYNAQSFYTKVSGTVGMGRYDCKSIY